MSSGPNQRVKQLSGHLKGSSADGDQPIRELPEIRQVAGDSASQYVCMLIATVTFHITQRCTFVDQSDRRVKGKVVIITGQYEVLYTYLTFTLSFYFSIRILNI